MTIRNFGGKASYDEGANIFTVEGISDLRVRATPELEVLKLHAVKRPGLFE